MATYPARDIPSVSVRRNLADDAREAYKAIREFIYSGSTPFAETPEWLTETMIQPRFTFMEGEWH